MLTVEETIRWRSAVCGIQTGKFVLRLGELYFPVSGSNETMLSWLLGYGRHIACQYLFVSTRPLGRYICHNPLYYL